MTSMPGYNPPGSSPAGIVRCPRCRLLLRLGDGDTPECPRCGARLQDANRITAEYINRVLTCPVHPDAKVEWHGGLLRCEYEHSLQPPDED